jgi:hypothetical protein
MAMGANRKSVTILVGSRGSVVDAINRIVAGSISNEVVGCFN